MEYGGEYPESMDPARRLARMFNFFHARAVVYEPTYAMMRRDVLDARICFRCTINKTGCSLWSCGEALHCRWLIF